MISLSSAALADKVPSYSMPQELTVGGLIELALTLHQKHLTQKACSPVYSVSNSSTDDFLSMLEKSGLKDISGFRSRWRQDRSLERGGCYSEFSKYILSPNLYVESVADPRHRLAVRFARTDSASCRELLRFFIEYRERVLPLLDDGFRIIALASDNITGFGHGAVISKRDGQFCLEMESLTGLIIGLPKDLFLGRVPSVQ